MHSICPVFGSLFRHLVENIKIDSKVGLTTIGDVNGDGNSDFLIVDGGNGKSYFDNTEHTTLVGINKSTPTVALDVIGSVKLSGVLKLPAYTVATLPAGVIGDYAYVTDALAPAYLATIVGGGAVVTHVFYDGTNWVAH